MTTILIFTILVVVLGVVIQILLFILMSTRSPGVTGAYGYMADNRIARKTHWIKLYRRMHMGYSHIRSLMSGISGSWCLLGFWEHCQARTLGGVRSIYVGRRSRH